MCALLCLVCCNSSIKRRQERTQEWHPVKNVRNACKVRCNSIHIGVHNAVV